MEFESASVKKRVARIICVFFVGFGACFWLSGREDGSRRDVRLLIVSDTNQSPGELAFLLKNQGSRFVMPDVVTVELKDSAEGWWALRSSPPEDASMLVSGTSRRLRVKVPVGSSSWRVRVEYRNGLEGLDLWLAQIWITGRSLSWKNVLAGRIIRESVVSTKTHSIVSREIEKGK